MLCQQCGKHTATTHMKRTVNGQTTEWHLCSECAAAQGLGHLLPGFGFQFDTLFGNLFAEPTARTDTVRCEGCGRSFAELAKAGRAGCPQCYETFYDRLLPSIQRIHGKTRHTGKVAAGGGKAAKKANELDRLRRELDECIARQQYERCAELRDRIAAREKEDADHE